MDQGTGSTGRRDASLTADVLDQLQAALESRYTIQREIGHGGPVAESRGNRSPALGPTSRVNVIAMNRSQEATVADLERVVAAHGRAAARAVEAGFDAVEVHLGHNYLASAFLSPKLNRRTDGYGGGLRKRARLAREIMQGEHAVGRFVREHHDGAQRDHAGYVVDAADRDAGALQRTDDRVPAGRRAEVAARERQPRRRHVVAAQVHQHVVRLALVGRASRRGATVGQREPRDADFDPAAAGRHAPLRTVTPRP